MTFSELLRSEEEILKRLLIVSQRQLELVQAEDVAVLIQHLGQSVKLWNEFELLEQQLEPHKGIPQEQRKWNSADERQMTEATLNRCKSLMKQILENDQVSLTTMAAKKEEMAAKKEEMEAKLNQVHRKKDVVMEYTKQSRQQS